MTHFVWPIKWLEIKHSSGVDSTKLFCQAKSCYRILPTFCLKLGGQNLILHFYKICAPFAQCFAPFASRNFPKRESNFFEQKSCAKILMKSTPDILQNSYKKYWHTWKWWSFRQNRDGTLCSPFLMPYLVK